MCSPVRGLKTAQSFQCARPHENRSIFNEIRLVGTTTKNNRSNVPDFFGSESFVSWVPNRQNQSPADEMAPSPPKKRPYLGSQGHMGPKTGFTGSAFSIRSNVVGGRFAQNGHQERENPVFRRLKEVGSWKFRFGPRAAAKFLPQTPKNQ